MAPGRTKKKQQLDWARDLGKDLNRIRNHYGCDILVTLVRHSELVAIHTPNLFKEVESRGMDSIHFPIKDKYVPNSMDEFMVLIETIIGKLKEGKTVVVHCNGGKGRSGTVLVATLVALGRKVQQAIDVVRKARAGTIQNPLQIAYVKSFKTAWRKSKHKQLKEQEKRAPPALMRSFESPAPVEEEKLDLEEPEDEKLNPEERAAWKQHKKQIKENQDKTLTRKINKGEKLTEQEKKNTTQTKKRLTRSSQKATRHRTSNEKIRKKQSQIISRTSSSVNDVPRSIKKFSYGRKSLPNGKYGIRRNGTDRTYRNSGR